ncbi:MAG: hypothetical protein A3F11_11685 [Gammaproteobacteria bacterium RIFCSPHIGHO2_12_FULL_37_14]|nr:MAG: hypothetical protein A3F11_11685 [Gammaproteobacteria bacterium RIFCSPHIGHO2_12_FULL_37_14]
MFNKILFIFSLFIIIFSAINANASPKLCQNNLFIINFIEWGDYCWVTGTFYHNDQTIIKKFIVNTNSTLSLCNSGDSSKETKKWHGKRLKIFVKKIKICDYEPPCNDKDTKIEVDAIVNYKIIK